MPFYTLHFRRQKNTEQKTKRIKYLRINLPKKTKELYTENYKTLMKGTKADINIWRDIPCSWGGGINIVTMTTPKRNQQIQCSLYQITNGIFHTATTKNFTICRETQKIPNGQSNLEKEEWSWRNQPS